MIEVVEFWIAFLQAAFSETLVSLQGKLIPLRSLFFSNIQDPSVAELRFLLYDMFIGLLVRPLYHVLALSK